MDDLTAGPNQFLKYLLYTENTILGGLIHGIYPHGNLELEPTGADMWSFPTLDIRIISKRRMVRDELTSTSFSSVFSYSVLYDIRREKCYEGIPIAQYTHVSSEVGQNVGSSILMGQMHRFRELIMDKEVFSQECALLLLRMQNRGYNRTGLSKKLERFVKRYPDMFGQHHHLPLYVWKLCGSTAI